jgi:hypothetical protein
VALDAPGVFLRSQRGNDRQGEVATVGLEAHRTGGEAHPVLGPLL